MAPNDPHWGAHARRPRTTCRLATGLCLSHLDKVTSTASLGCGGTSDPGYHPPGASVNRGRGDEHQPSSLPGRPPGEGSASSSGRKGPGPRGSSPARSPSGVQLRPGPGLLENAPQPRPGKGGQGEVSSVQPHAHQASSQGSFQPKRKPQPTVPATRGKAPTPVWLRRCPQAPHGLYGLLVPHLVPHSIWVPTGGPVPRASPGLRPVEGGQ